MGIQVGQKQSMWNRAFAGAWSDKKKVSMYYDFVGMTGRRTCLFYDQQVKGKVMFYTSEHQNVSRRTDTKSDHYKIGKNPSGHTWFSDYYIDASDLGPKHAELKAMLDYACKTDEEKAAERRNPKELRALNRAIQAAQAAW